MQKACEDLYSVELSLVPTCGDNKSLCCCCLGLVTFSDIIMYLLTHTYSMIDNASDYMSDFNPMIWM